MTRIPFTHSIKHVVLIDENGMAVFVSTPPTAVQPGDSITITVPEYIEISELYAQRPTDPQ